MEFAILEARRFFSSCESNITRKVKDYEIDMECASGRIYSYDTIHRQRLSPGDVLVRKPNSFVEAAGRQNSYLLTLDFSGAAHTEMYSRNVPGLLQEITENESILRLEPIIHPTHEADVIRIYQNLISLPSRDSTAAKELVHELIYTLNAEISKKNYSLLKPNETIAENIIAYMQEHLGGHVSLDDLSKLVHLEKSHMLRRFRGETGKTPIEMLIEMRLDKASDLVVTTNLNIYRIAAECGYETISYFIASYKKRYGMTPEAHRALLQKEK